MWEIFGISWGCTHTKKIKNMVLNGLKFLEMHFKHIKTYPQIQKVKGYLFCSFTEFFNSVKNSRNFEKWKETTKFTRILSQF